MGYGFPFPLYLHCCRVVCKGYFHNHQNTSKAYFKQK